MEQRQLQSIYIATANDYYPFGMVMPHNSNDSLLFISGFESGTDGWLSYSYSTTLTQDGGRLKVSASVVWGTVDKPLSLTVGKQYRVRFTIDMGNCSELHVPIYKSDISSYETLSGVGISVTASGTYEGTFTATSNSMLMFFEMISGVNPPPDSIGYYWLDNISIEEVKPTDTTHVGKGGYRYGFNGKELDKEVSGTTTYDYGFRIYNPGLGRFLSVDPITKKYPELTPYQFASNTPIQAIDLDGLEAYYVKTILPTGKTLITIITDVKIVDYTGTNLTHDQIKAYGEKFKHALESGYNFTDKSSNTTYNLIVRDIKVVNTFDEKKDFGFELVDWGGSGVLGNSESIGNSKVNNMKISITGQGNSGMDRTVEHEFGHVLGLRHPKDEKDVRGDPQSTLSITESPDNLIRQSDYSSGRKLLLKQFKIAIKTIEKDKGGYTIDFKKIYKKVANYFKTNFK